MVAARYNLLGMNLQELVAFAEEIGERRYRGQQLFDWLYAKGAESFGGMTNLGRDFRQRLASRATIEGVHLLGRRSSVADGTTKFLFGLSDGLRIETVLIPPAVSFQNHEAEQEEEQRRLTLCVSTQVGCPLDCIFCATGTMGFFRNLTAGEILDQVRQVKHITGRPLTNIVFMGMGEPLLNYRNVMEAAEILSTGMKMATRRITVSTAGWVEGIRRMADERRKSNLAVSLHSAVEETRRSLMPISRKYPLDHLKKALEHYYARVRQRITYEVVFFDGINDTDAEVNRLVKFLRGVPSKINVIPFHPIAPSGVPGPVSRLRPSPRRDEIVRRLRALRLTVMVRSSAGEEIDAACGQLAVRA
ncbi:MAG: 23S rRNA (adenine(2503)-C(2))-methyltransferase RlmN [Bacteroidota bacterium]